MVGVVGGARSAHFGHPSAGLPDSAILLSLFSSKALAAAASKSMQEENHFLYSVLCAES